jgi:hypothetical protein
MTRRYLAWLALLVLAALCINAQVRPFARPATPPRLPAAGFVFPPAPTAARPIAAATPVQRRPSQTRHAVVAAPVALVSSVNESYVMAQAPSISPAVIAATLRRLGSPLAGLSDVIYRTGRAYGIDPAYLLAFVAYFDRRVPLPDRAHNVGRIRATGREPSVQGYRAFGSWEQGITAWYRLMRDLYVRRWHLRSLDAVLPVYAPSTRVGVEDELGQMEAMIAAWRHSSP